MNQVALAVDIGGSKYMAGLVRRDGEVLCAERREWSTLTPEAVMEDILIAAKQMLTTHPEYQPVVVGVTIPGLADPLCGNWVEASFSGIRDLAVARQLQEATNIPCYVENDANACVLAEKLFGSCKDCDDFVYMTVSNGVGGGLFSGGRLCYGSSGNAMEIGHCVVVEDGRLCKCGTKGCLEAYAAGPGVAKTYLEFEGTVVSPNAQSIAAQARLGEPAAIQTFQLEGKLLGTALATACNLLCPQKVVIGGGISLAFDLFEASLLDTISQRIYKRAQHPGFNVVPTSLGYNGALLGAAAVGFCRLENLYDMEQTIRKAYSAAFN